MNLEQRKPTAFLAALLLAAMTARAATAPLDEEIVVHVQKDGPEISLDIDCPLDAPWPIVWEVLTDYDHMARFLSNLEASDVLERADNVLRVHQKGKAYMGPFTMNFDNVRRIELVPYDEIRSRIITGDMKASFVTRIVRVGEQIHIVNSGRYTPDVWVPPIIGPALIEAQARRQFGELRAEILRRAAKSDGPA
ncbi:MAG TPA: SRPBCC family protein [Usitatibacter sp.]|nr:SRPBCC family protein [Usitatibacter sp.]